jgi:hypothetical protein
MNWCIGECGEDTCVTIGCGEGKCSTCGKYEEIDCDCPTGDEYEDDESRYLDNEARAAR